jgi:transcriptional regulator with XRE-family HTH domain
VEVDIPKAIGIVLKRMREERNLSQEAFGHLVGLHRTHISLLERGKRNPFYSTIYQISVKLGIPMSDLVVQIQAEIDKHSKQQPV